MNKKQTQEIETKLTNQRIEAQLGYRLEHLKTMFGLFSETNEEQEFSAGIDDLFGGVE